MELILLGIMIGICLTMAVIAIYEIGYRDGGGRHGSL